jgi:group II intron reverse transcriptase/maturase
MATSSAETVSTRLQQIAELARTLAGRRLTTLSHHVDVEFLREAYRRTRKDAAPGIDGENAEDFGRHLDQRLSDLLERFKSGRYFAPPVRRTSIPKEKGRTRPLGIPTFEDKVLQRAVTMVLSAVYEQDFLDCSYGFRPRRSAHQALIALREGLRTMGGRWVLDVDIRSFFDNLVHSKLREILDQRVRDGVLRRTIHKWLKAGILEDGELRRPRGGTPQGGVISPLLANIYLHEVVDRWFHDDILPRLRGRAFLVRYADDCVMVFQREEDARRVLEVLPKRLARFGLTLHPEKTRLVHFRPSAPRADQGPKKGDASPNTFDFLGFTHYWGLSRKRRWTIKRKTQKSRFRRALMTVRTWCREHRHWPIDKQHAILVSKLHGHYAYYGIPGNSSALSRFRWSVVRLWRYWLGRRSQRGRLSWEAAYRLFERWPLPNPKIGVA